MANQGKKLVWTEVEVPKTSVTVYEALHRRRMAWKFKDQPVPKEAINRMLAAAVWAPNHRWNEPWRFFVIEQDSPVRKKVADAVFKGLMEEWDSERRAAPYRDKVLEAPVVIYVYHLADDDWFIEKENYAATVAAQLNLSLAGFAEGLSVTWDTGRVTRVPEVDKILGAEASWKLMTMLSIGYPDEESVSARTPVTELARWV